MQPVNTIECNTMHVAEGCSDLPTKVSHDSERGTMIESVWELDADELMSVLETKRIRLILYCSAQPPVNLEVVNVGEAQ